MLRQIRGEILLLLTLTGFAVAGCGGTKTAPPPDEVTSGDILPPYAISAKPHVGSLSVHSSTREGGDQQPAPAPDGSWFVFASTRNSEEPQIYRQPSAGSIVTQLTQGPIAHIQPAVSPDGRQIAFAGRDSGSWDIWIMPAGGGPRENLNSTLDLDEISPTWHPKGKVLAFNCQKSSGGEWWLCAKARGSSGVSWITPGMNPDWSPKGDMIVFQRAKKRGKREFSLWIVKVSVDANGLVAGGAESQIVSNPAWGAVEPVFSPDGTRIAFTAIDLTDKSANVKGGDIWCVRTDGTDLIRLTNTVEEDWDPAWSGQPGDTSTNGRVFFACERNGHMNIWSLLPALSGAPGIMPGLAP